MPTYVPIKLAGENLGERHHCLNTLVNEAYQQNVSFNSIKDLPEESAVDRIFKINLASKYRDIDYIVNTFKDDNMLFVSTAMKCTWLLDADGEHVINPQYLETTLYPEMLTVAVNKMKHWVSQHLRDVKRCRDFYQYYKNNLDMAVKFLPHCGEDYILEEIANVMDKLMPKHLKFLYEKCPRAAKIYYDNLIINDAALTKYTDDERKYFKCLKYILKLDGDLFLDITEKYFNKDLMSAYSPSATRHIMKIYKRRFLEKAELYTYAFLDMNTLALFLNTDEIKELVLKLARAKYLEYWFSYKRVEPLIKRLDVEERKSFKKLIFVDKDVGDIVEEWPYPIPSSPRKEYYGNHVFKDTEASRYEYESCDDVMGLSFKSCLLKRKCAAYMSCEIVSQEKSMLDRLFDRYRFTGFGQTLFELRKRMAAESSGEVRRSMMLVLVSKSGGEATQVESLLKLLVDRHMNEPGNIRAAVIRSLVKRAPAWRLPDTAWNLMLEFGRGLGLDGTYTSVPCNEGLHSVVLRHIIFDTRCPSDVITAYLKNFSTLTDYSLNSEEIKLVSNRLPALLMSADAPMQLFQVLEAYKLKIDAITGVEMFLVEAARKDESLLRRLFEANISRPKLLRETFKLIQTDASYINALRHDATLLVGGETFVSLLKNGKSKHDRFLRLLSIFFYEHGGLAEQYLSALKQFTSSLLENDKLQANYTRPIAKLSNNRIADEFINIYIKENNIDASVRLILERLKAVGAKGIANRVLTCRDNEVECLTQMCLKNRSTMRLALRLSLRTSDPAPAFALVGKRRPTVPIKVALSNFRCKTHNLEIWNVVKSLIMNLSLEDNTKKYIRKLLADYDSIPESIATDYWTTVYLAFHRYSTKKAMPMLCTLETSLPDVEENFLRKTVEDFIKNELSSDSKGLDNNAKCLYARIAAKYLLLCKCEASQKDRLISVCEPFFDQMGSLMESRTDDAVQILHDFLRSLKYNKVFLDDRYVSSVPVFEIIAERLRKLLPLEIYFEKYVFLHLTLLYLKSVKQVSRSKPKIFEGLPKNVNEVASLVGMVFGKYIGKEIEELQKQFFQSINVIYYYGLRSFLTDNFDYSDSKRVFIIAIIRGLIDLGSREAVLMAARVFEREYSSNNTDPEVVSILKMLKESQYDDVKVYIFASICCK